MSYNILSQSCVKHLKNREKIKRDICNIKIIRKIKYNISKQFTKLHNVNLSER